MCKKCQAPENKYLIQDRETGLLVCEECGFAVKYLDDPDIDHGQYIWEVNPSWPVFGSFEDLMFQVCEGRNAHLPPCRPIPGIPSRLLTYCVDLLYENDDGDEPAPEKKQVH